MTPEHVETSLCFAHELLLVHGIFCFVLVVCDLALSLFKGFHPKNPPEQGE